MAVEFAAYTEDGRFAPKRMAHQWNTTVEDVALSVGLARDAVTRSTRITATKTQTRLREVTEIITRVAPRYGSDMLAYAWYRSVPLAGYAVPAMRLVQDGHADWVHHYLDRLDAGVHA